MKAYARSAAPRPDHVYACATTAMVSTSHPLATEAALDMLRRDGSVADAYIAAAAVQVVVEPPMTTFGGFFSMSLFDRASERTTALGGTFARPEAESGEWDEAGADGGRTATVPGWLNGARAAWRHAGKLKWRELFEHALFHAREGFVIDPTLCGWVFEYRLKMARFPAGQKIWYPQGYLLGIGDHLVQEDLANTIEHIQADEELEWFYAGEFARRYVDVVRAAGGNLTVEDMAKHRGAGMSYHAEPVGEYRGYDVHAPGGTLIGLGLQSVEHGNLRELGRPGENPESLYLQMRLIEELWRHGLKGGAFHTQINTRPHSSRASPEISHEIWSRLVNERSRPYDPMNPGTNALVIADAVGNVAFGAHSCACSPFGNGHIVDGVWVSRPLAVYGQPTPVPSGIAAALLLTRGGKACFAAGSPSISCMSNIMQNTINVVEFGMSLEESVSQPMFGASKYPSRRAMLEGNFTDATYAHIEQRGMGYLRVSPLEPEMGSCHMLQIDRDGGRIYGVADPRRRGQAAGL